VGEQSELYVDPATKRGKNFRRRFRMPMKNFRKIMALIREENWFPSYEIRNAKKKDPSFFMNDLECPSS
jgi:hypothetical protein